MTQNPACAALRHLRPSGFGAISATRRMRAAFTLVEMMVVIVIIGILAAVIIVNISGRADKAKVKATEAIIAEVAQQVEMFKLNHNRYPQNIDDLASPSAPPYIQDAKDWQPLLTKPARDGWGNPLVYRLPGSDGRPFDLVSYGEDGRDGGEGYAADISFFQQK